VARIVADYVDNHDPWREQAWIEVDGDPVGCVFCTRRVGTFAPAAMCRPALHRVCTTGGVWA
jgi:hypothetical protein